MQGVSDIIQWLRPPFPAEAIAVVLIITGLAATLGAIEDWWQRGRGD